MNVSENGLAIIKKYEGCKLKAYLCPAGVWTIGYGHTGPDVKRGTVITKAKAEQLLVQDVVKFTNGVLKAVSPRIPSQAELDAMVSLAFNIGIGAFAKSSICRFFKSGDKAKAAQSFNLYTKAKNPKTGVREPLAGLVRRRNEESRLFLSKADAAVVARKAFDNEIVNVPEASIVPEAPKPLSRSREIIGGGVVGGGGILQLFDMFTVDDARQTKESLGEIKHETGFVQKLHIPEIASVLAVILSVFIIWKRFKDRREGVR